MPTFDNERDAIEYMNEQLGRMDARLIKVEGENLALKSVVTILRHVIADDELKAFFEEQARKRIDEMLAVAESYDDDNTRALIDAYVETMKILMVTEFNAPELPAFTIVRGGKE